MSYESQLAAVSEGFCPEHRTPLGADGWCGQCGHRCGQCEPQGAWWRIYRDPDSETGSPTVATVYPPIAP